MAATQTSTTPPSLTLSSTTFAKLSPHPYLLANLQPPDPSATPSSRTNGRQPHEARRPNVNTSSLTHAHGSAVVRTGDTTVICGVRGETLLVSDIPNFRHHHDDDDDDDNDPENPSTAETDELRDYDLLVPNIELATGCAPNFLPGVPPSTLAQTLSTRLYSLLHSSEMLDVEDLRIYHHPAAESQSQNQQKRRRDQDTAEMDVDDNDDKEEPTETAAEKKELKAYWTLYIDVLFISFDGNPFDVAWASLVAALRDTKLPRARWDADAETVLCSRTRPPRPLAVRGLPIACTAAVFAAKEGRQRRRQRQRRKTTATDEDGGSSDGQFWVLVDPDRLEESLCDESVTMVVDRVVAAEGKGEEERGETKSLSISKSGGVVFGPELMRRFVAVAEARWKEFRDVLTA